MMPHEHITPGMRQCIKECSDCHDICLETIHYCLHKGGRHAEAHHIRLLSDCVQICHTSEDFMLRGSDLHGHTCRACAEVCQHCSEACDKTGDDAQMKTCADSCRRCAESCRKMAVVAA